MAVVRVTALKHTGSVVAVLDQTAMDYLRDKRNIEAARAVVDLVTSGVIEVPTGRRAVDGANFQVH